MLEFEYRENCIQSTGILLRDQLLSLGLLKPGIDCATVGWEEELEVPPQRFPVKGHVFRQNPTQAERAVDETRDQLHSVGYVFSETTALDAAGLQRTLAYFQELRAKGVMSSFAGGA